MICEFVVLWLLSVLLGTALLGWGKALKTHGPIGQNRYKLQNPETLGSESSFPTDHLCVV